MWWKRKPQDFKAEIDAHLQLEADELRSEGLAPVEAQEGAQRAFGNRTLAEERFYESRQWMLGQHLARDLRYATRVLVKDAKFSALAVLGLGLGIGVSTAIFAVVKPLLQPHGAQVYNSHSDVARNSALYIGLERLAPEHSAGRNFSFPEYRYFQDQSTTLSEISAESNPFNFVLNGISKETDAEVVAARFESASSLSVLGLRPALGRSFSEAEERVGSPPVAILSHRFWQRRFAGDAGILGKTIVLNAHALTIVGVADSRFHKLDSSAVFLPFGLQPLLLDLGNWLHDSEASVLGVTARLRPGVVLTQAQAEADVLGEAFAQTHSMRSQPTGTARENAARGRILLFAGGENPQFRRQRAEMELAINLVVSMILLIACSNLANLLLARTVVRRREIGVRLSLGASRARLICQLLTENLLLAIAGGAVGLIFSTWLAKPLFILVNRVLGLEVNLEPRMFIYGIVLSLITGISFGLGPAFTATKINVACALHSEGLAGTTSSPSQKIWSPRNLLVVIPLAISLMLMIGAASMVRSAQSVYVSGKAFDTSQVIGMSFRLKVQGYDEAKAAQFQENLRERLRVMPGVVSVALTRDLPLSLPFALGMCGLSPEGATIPTRGTAVECNVVSSGFFETLGVPIVRGRVFVPSDREGSAPVAIVSQELARRYWPNEDPIGKRLRSDGGSASFEVIGVASDLGDSKGMFLVPPTIYVPFGQGSLLLTSHNGGWNGTTRPPQGYQISQMQFVIRTNGEPANVKAALRQTVRAADPSLWVGIQTIEERLEPFTAPMRTTTLVFSVLGGLAMLMASAGIYALLAFAVSQRTHEIGIRMALGAHRRQILSLVMHRTIVLIVCGIGLGLAGALALHRVLVSANPGTKEFDFVTCISVALLLGAVSLLASYLPARKALSVNPMQALRCE